MRLTYVLYAALFALALVAQAEADPQKCETQQGSVQTSLYDFSYGSWSSNNGSDYSVTHCIQNSGAKPLLVDWDGTDLKGFAMPQSAMRSVLSNLPAPQFTSNDRDLWYGSRPLKKSIGTIAFDSSVVISPSDGKSVETATNIAIPFNIYRAYYGSSQTYPEGIEDRPGALRNVTLKFVTTINPDTGNFEQFCHYFVEEQQGDRGYTTISYQIQFSDKNLNEVMFGTADPITISGGEPKGIVAAQGRAVKFSGSEFEFSATQKLPDGGVGIKSASLIFYLGDRTIGSIPVRFFGGG